MSTQATASPDTFTPIPDYIFQHSLYPAEFTLYLAIALHVNRAHGYA